MTRKAFHAATWMALLFVMALALAACGATGDDVDGTPGTLPETGEDITGTLPGPGLGVTDTMTDTPEMIETPEEMPTSESMTSTGGLTGTTGTGEDTVVELAAQNFEFDQDEITVPAGAEVTIEFTNLDPVGHNFAVYDDLDVAMDAATRFFSGEEEDEEGELFEGEVITDTATTYVFTAPTEPGTYYFVCEPHSTTMTGTLVVE